MTGQSTSTKIAPYLRLSSGLFIVATMLALSGCGGGGKLVTGSIGRTTKPVEKMSGAELANTKVDFGKAYARDPKNKEAGIAYANVLRMNGSNDQALAVMRQTAIHHPNDRDVLSAYGKALAGAGELAGALDAVRRAQRPEYPDWKLLSAEGAILDQMGKANEARELYRKALDIAPGEASIQSNLGMSYLLEGDLKTAETYLSAAARSPSADSTVRQNLALVVGLQGRFDEAEQIASRELSPEQAQANLAYLRQMLAQQNSLDQLKKADGNPEAPANAG
ncbi:MAG: tetratricopeptide repeat protein [Rhizobiaceae bacterium]